MESSRAEPASPRTVPVRTKADREAERPVVDEPEMAPDIPDEPGAQPVETAVEQLPAVDELAKRLSPEVRAVLDELFRPQWTEVRRLRPEDLRN
jgi:hypothetical protein